MDKYKRLEPVVESLVRDNGKMTLAQIAKEIDVHVSHTGQIVRCLESERKVMTKMTKRGKVVLPASKIMAANPLSLPMSQVAQVF